MEHIDSVFLQKLKDKSIFLYLSSCEYKDELLQLPYDYIILNSKSFGLRGQAGKIRMAGKKVILMPFDNEYCIRLMIDAGLKIRFFVGVQDGCCEGGNHECINSQTFFTRLSPLIGEQCLYLTNHLFLRRRPVEKRLPFKFHSFRLERLPFDAACLSDYKEVTAKWRLFKVSRVPSDSVFYMIGNTGVHVHHTSLWDCNENIDGWIIPHYPPQVLHNYLPGFNPEKYLFHKQAAEEMFSWANENKLETIASIPFDSDANLSTAFLDRLYKGNDSYPKCIHFFHVKDHELQLFRDRLRKDHTRMLLGIQNDNAMYKILKEDLELGRGDTKIIPYLMLQYGPRSLNPLLSGLRCPNMEMRYQCILSLGKLFDPGSVKPLINMFDDPANEKMESLLWETIGQICGWGKMDPVYHALHHGSHYVRFHMARILSEFGDKKVYRHLIRALKENEVDVMAVCGALKDMSVYHHDRESASGVLCDCLKDEHPWKRGVAAGVLGSAGNLDAAWSLINAIRLHPGEKYLHRQAGASLAMIFEEYEDAALKVELDLLLADDAFVGKESMLRVLCPDEYSHEETLDKEDVAPQGGDDHSDAQDPESDKSTITKEYTFQEHGWEETHMVTPASGTFEELIGMLESDDPEVQLSAINALRKLGDRRATKYFNRLLPRLTTFFRQEIVETMAHLRDRRAVPVLSTVFPGAWVDLKMGIIRGFHHIGGPGVHKPLILALNDKHPKVRYLAAWAMGELKLPGSRKALKKALLREKHDYVKKTIEESLGNFRKSSVQ